MGVEVPVLSDTLALMREAERIVIGRTFKPRQRFVIELVDALVHAPWFVLAGMQGLLYTLARAAYLILAWWAILAITTWLSKSESGGASTAGLFYGAMFLTVGSILLGLPSGLLAQFVRDEHVSKLATYIAMSSPDEASAKVLRAGVERMEAAGRQRILGIGWLLGFIWALLIWVATNWVLAPDVSATVRSGAASYGLLGFFVYTVFVVIFSGYRQAHRMLNETIAFAFLEAEATRLSGKV